MGKKYDRQMEIINMLMFGNRLKCRNLAFEFGVSTKTIKKDISELSLYYPIDTYQGNGGGIELGKGYTINGYLMKRKYLDLLADGLYMLKTVNPDPDIVLLIDLITRKRV